MSKLSQRVWETQKLSILTNMVVCRACIVSTLLYGSEFWKTYAVQKKRLNVLHLRCLLRILSVSWQDHITTSPVLESRHPLCIYPPMPKTPAVDWPCPSNGRGPHSQETLVRRTGTMKKAGAPLQRRGEEGNAGHWSSNRSVGDSCQ